MKNCPDFLNQRIRQKPKYPGREPKVSLAMYNHSWPCRKGLAEATSELDQKSKYAKAR
jgi:hypothetical protein